LQRELSQGKAPTTGYEHGCTSSPSEGTTGPGWQSRRCRPERAAAGASGSQRLAFGEHERYEPDDGSRCPTSGGSARTANRGASRHQRGEPAPGIGAYCRTAPARPSPAAAAAVAPSSCVQVSTARRLLQRHSTLRSHEAALGSHRKVQGPTLPSCALHIVEICPFALSSLQGPTVCCVWSREGSHSAPP
jgi:hypothetical protein